MERGLGRGAIKPDRDIARFSDLAVPIAWDIGRVTMVALASYERDGG